MLTIKERRTVNVPVEVVSFRWGGKFKAGTVACVFGCSACGEQLGTSRIGIAWVKHGTVERSLRLCEDCGVKAEQDAAQLTENVET